MAKRPVPRYDFKAFGAAIKAAREGCKESRKKVGDEMFISPRYLANIDRKRVPTSVFSPSRAAARRLKIACWEVSQTLGTERKGAKQWTDAKGRCKSNSE